MSDPLVLGIPSKGRLKEASSAYFAERGIEIVSAGNARSYRGRVAGMGETVEVAFLSAPEIAREIAAGAVHMGVTGLDQLHETVAGADDRVELIAPLGFGHCDLIVAVPEAWIDVDTMADLDDVAGSFRPRHGRRLTVATKYINTTRAFFAGHGIADYRIVESLGATEGAPSTGAADIIVDITSTGSTLRANGLKILDDGVILKSEAHLAASLAADWQAVPVSAMATLAGKLRKKGAYKRLARRAGFKPAV